MVGGVVAARPAVPRARGPLARGISSRETLDDNSRRRRRPRLLFRVRVGSVVVVRAIGTNSRLHFYDIIRAVPFLTTSLSLEALRNAVVAATAGARRSEIIIIGAAVLVVAYLCETKRESSGRRVDGDVWG